MRTPFTACIAGSIFAFAVGCGGETQQGGADTQTRDTLAPPTDTAVAALETMVAVETTQVTQVNDVHIDGQIQVIDEPVGDPIPAGQELPVEVVRNFECLEQGVGAELVVAPVVGADGDVLAIHPSGAAGCQYSLVYKAADGTVTPVSSSGSGYLFAAAVRQGATTLVCGSNIRHRAEGAGQTRYVEGVTIECAVKSGGAAGPFGPLTPVIVPDGSWAAWIRTLEVDAAHAGSFRLRYVRDFTFHIFNLSDNGRPASDGIYEVVVTIDGTRPHADVAAKLSDKTNPLAGGTPFEEWKPSDEDKAIMSEFIDFSEGPCPNGCPAPATP
jgi:hypothetical protein